MVKDDLPDPVRDRTATRDLLPESGRAGASDLALPPAAAGKALLSSQWLDRELIGKTRVLFVASDPDPTHPLALEEEAARIQAGISQLQADEAQRLRTAAAGSADDVRPGGAIHLEPRFAPQRSQLLRAGEDVRPHIVHFSGHGSLKSEILLREADGPIEPVPQKAMLMLMRSFGSASGRLAVLVYCRSLPAARAIVEAPTGMACAVGMDGPILDAAAIDFSAAFYWALGRGGSVAEAFDKGREAAAFHRDQEAIPQLCTRAGEDARALVLVPPPGEAPLPRDDLDRPFATLEEAEQFLQAPRARVAAVLYHAAWSKRSAAQLQALRRVVSELATEVRGGFFEATDETVDKLWGVGIRAFPTLRLRARSGQERKVCGGLTEDELRQTLRELLG
jgi:hypothetical protein